jgi:hypothetical protein
MRVTCVSCCPAIVLNVGGITEYVVFGGSQRIAHQFHKCDPSAHLLRCDAERVRDLLRRLPLAAQNVECALQFDVPDPIF